MVSWKLRCVACGAEYPGLEVRYRCTCGETLDVVHDLDSLDGETLRKTFDARLGSRRPLDRSGVWRYRELILPLPESALLTRLEGNTRTYDSARVARYAGVQRLTLKHEGENPTGSFKDRGMAAGITIAAQLGMTRVACASTGNTSASMASYAALAGMEALVFIPEGKIAFGKLAQALAYGATTIEIPGDFDTAMALVQSVCRQEGIYLLNSINPFRIEGQKAIVFELLQDLNWEVPDWIVLPGGNLGNNSALYKGLAELRAVGIISSLPRIAVIQAEGANPLYRAFTSGKAVEPVKNPQTVATAIKIGAPVSWRKSLRGIQATNGVVEQVSDQEIMDAKAQVDRAGIGAEPASCATVAGVRKLTRQGVIHPEDRVCGILTGHLLKDPDAVVQYHRGDMAGITSSFGNHPIRVEGGVDAVLQHLRRR